MIERLYAIRYAKGFKYGGEYSGLDVHAVRWLGNRLAII